jgi:DNA primase
MHKENCSKHEAINKAKELIGPEAGSQSINSKVETQLSRIAILTKYYQSSLKAISKSPRAKEYASKRHLDINKLGIGFSGEEIGRRWNNHLQESALKLGVLTKNSVGKIQSKIKHCLFFPMKNQDGQIVDMYGRSILGKKGSSHFYLSGKQQGLYPGYPSRETKKLILTESIIDGSTLLSQKEITDNYSVLALYGTNGFTEQHKEAIKEWAEGLPDQKEREIILWFDGDEAGKKAIEKYSDQLGKSHPSIKISQVLTPEGEDINSLLDGHTSEILTELLKSRMLLRSLPESLSFSNESTNSIEKINVGKLDAKNPELLSYKTQELYITILGGVKITGLDKMKVTLKIVSQNTNNIIRQSLDFYHAKAVNELVALVASSLEISSTLVSQTLENLTTELEHYRENRLETLRPKKVEVYEMTDQEKQEAMDFLKSKNLISNTAKAIAASGIVGEETNALVGYITYLSRKRDKPLHVMYLGASGTGKTHLQEGLSLLIPWEDRFEATALSDQSLYYEGANLKGKVLFIEDIDGAENVMYIIRELQSKGRISKRVAWRDNKGHTQTILVEAKGPVVISSCTTRERVYEDNANRCILLYIDQSKEQDMKVMSYIKDKSAGKIIDSEQNQVRQLLQNSQRLLKSTKVYNPFAHLIDLPPEVFKPRRSLPLLLGFIETVTFFNQYQRTPHKNESKETYILSTYEDIEISFKLMSEVLFSKSDELTNASRNFLEKLKMLVKEGATFSSKEIRKQLRINPNNLKRYMLELQRYDYIKTKGGNRYRGYEYEITNYSEYSQLKNSIDKQLESILLKIKQLDKKSGSVVQSGSLAKMTHLTSSKSVD